VNVLVTPVPEFGVTETTTGGFLLAVTLNDSAGEVPPPGAGFVTVTLNIPAVAISVAEIEAVTWVALTNVVVSLLPLNLTTEEVMNPCPFTVSLNAGPPAAVEDGLRDVNVGAGFVVPVIV
jgi:hypothetical protein